MFEKNPPVPSGSTASAEASRFGIEGGAHELAHGALLRRIDWSELTARLNAARDLRRVLRPNPNNVGCEGEFADAAARFLNGRDENQTDVNLVGLEQNKGSPRIQIGAKAKDDEATRQTRCAANAGDARED